MIQPGAPIFRRKLQGSSELLRVGLAVEPRSEAASFEPDFTTGQRAPAGRLEGPVDNGPPAIGPPIAL